MFRFNWKYLFFLDLETTGFDPIRNDVLTLCVVVTDLDCKPVATFYEKCRPKIDKFVTDESCKIHGFSRQQMAKFPPRIETLKKLLWFLNDYRTPDQYENLIFHANGNFDWRFLEWCFRKEDLHFSLWKMFDHRFLHSTLKMARAAGYSKNKLSDWAERLGFDLDHHNAKSDTECCVEIYKYLNGNKGLLNGEIIDSNIGYDYAEKLHADGGQRVNQ